MSTFQVNSVSGLNSALGSASSGDTIYLASGNYSGVWLQNLNFAGGVTITSQDPNHQAVLNGLKLTNDSGMHFSNLEVSTVGSTDAYAARITSVQNVSFDHMNVHGTMDGNPQNDVQGFFIRESSNVSVTNSEFQQLYTGIDHLNSDHITFSNNNIHDVRMDGIRGGGSSYVTVTNNTFSNFHPVAGDHADAIQFWTAGTTAVAHDITISGNVATRGTGDPTDGIFMKDEVGTLPYQNVKIENNVMTGEHYNSITVQGGANVDIGGNTVTSYADQNAYIRVEATSGAVVHDNTAMFYMYDTNTTFLEYGNVQTTDPSKLVMSGGGTNDLFFSTLGDDSIDGGAGNDTVSYINAKSAVVVDLSLTTLQNTLGAGKDQLVNIENLNGSSYGDYLTGDSGANLLSGGDGNDQLTGGLGADTLSGGAGTDRFVYRTMSESTVELAGRDVITDFSHLDHDRIDFRPLEAVVGKAFAFVTAFTGVAGQIQAVAEGDHYAIQLDVNGDKVADFAVSVSATTTAKWSAGDFLL